LGQKKKKARKITKLITGLKKTTFGYQNVQGSMLTSKQNVWSSVDDSVKKRNRGKKTDGQVKGGSGGSQAKKLYLR